MQFQPSEELRRRGIRLEWATNGWNILEVIVTVSLGLRVRSLALLAFGLDSVVEIFASTVVIQNLSDLRVDRGDRRIHRALRLIAIAFWLLGAFLLTSSARNLALVIHPVSTPMGIAFMAVTVVVMLGLAWLKGQTARAMGSETLAAEAAMTMLDGCLSLGILIALVLNTTTGLWWADACAAIVVAVFALSEGTRHWRDSRPHVNPDADTRSAC
jgi:divalent metal cation (Fe/Co/Zn/Cd) transporter